MSDDENKEENLIVLEINQDGSNSLEFSDLEEFKAWIEKELGSWKWIPGGVTNQIRAMVYDPLTRANGHIINAIQQQVTNPGGSKSHLNNAITVLQNHYKNRKTIFSSGPDFEFLELLRQKDPTSAAYALSYLLDVQSQIPWNSLQAFEGLMEVKLYLGEIDSTSQVTNREAIGKIIEGANADISKFKADQETLANRINELKDTTTETISTFEASFDNDQVSRENSFEKLLKESREELEGVKKAYEQHMSLEAPVNYWKKRAESYTKQGLAAIFVFCIAFWLGGDFIMKNGKKFLEVPRNEFHYGKGAYFLFIAFVIFWVLKLIGNFIMSRLHLGSESRDKSVLIETYLSLLKENHVDTEERELVLRNIFQTSNTGLIKEDHQLPALEIINKILNK